MTVAVLPTTAITVDRDALYSAASFVRAAAEKRSTIPVLSTIRIEVANGQLALVATNLDITLRETIPVNSGSAPLGLCVDSGLFLRVLGVLTDDSITLDVAEQSLALTQGDTTIQIDGLLTEDYPTFTVAPDEGGCVLPVTAVAQAVARTSFAITHEETRFQLNGALLKIQPNKMEMVATDGHRMAHFRATGKFGPKPIRQSFLPRGALEQLPRLGGETMRFGRVENYIFFASGTRSLTVRQIEINFPNHENVVPQDNTNVAVVSSTVFRAALRRAATMTNPRTHSCILKFGSDGISMETSVPGDGRANAFAPVLSYEGEPVTIGLSTHYLATFLDVVPDAEQITFRLKDGNAPIIAEPSGIDMTYVLMPMRLA